jgi:hypothetical protein
VITVLIDYLSQLSLIPQLKEIQTFIDKENQDLQQNW